MVLCVQMALPSRSPWPGVMRCNDKIEVNDKMLNPSADCSGSTKKTVIKSALEGVDKSEIGNCL